MKLLIATHNKSKVGEIKDILSDKFSKYLSLSDLGITHDVEENGNTFTDNAIIKAKFFKQFVDYAVLADDSGICVDALNGKPGIYSARYSGTHGDDKANRVKLLDEMKNTTNRTCHFECSAVLILPDDTQIVGIGTTFGQLLHSEQGDGGFGYDSIFFSDELKCSFGQASNQAKNAISHRYRALNSVLKQIEKNK